QLLVISVLTNRGEPGSRKRLAVSGKEASTDEEGVARPVFPQIPGCPTFATSGQTESCVQQGVKTVSDFKNPALMQLTDQQVRFAPPARRLEQLARAEQLLAEIEPARQYPYQYVCYRVTDFRPDSYPDLLIDGEDLEHDLCLFI